jgi:hypothetical protein
VVDPRELPELGLDEEPGLDDSVPQEQRRNGIRHKQTMGTQDFMLVPPKTNCIHGHVAAYKPFTSPAALDIPPRM